MDFEQLKELASEYEDPYWRDVILAMLERKKAPKRFSYSDGVITHTPTKAQLDLRDIDDEQQAIDEIIEFFQTKGQIYSKEDIINDFNETNASAEITDEMLKSTSYSYTLEAMVREYVRKEYPEKENKMFVYFKMGLLKNKIDRKKIEIKDGSITYMPTYKIVDPPIKTVTFPKVVKRQVDVNYKKEWDAYVRSISGAQEDTYSVYTETTT